MQEFKELKKALSLSVSKKNVNRSASIAYSKSGASYISGSIDSDTHLFNITSEQATLSLATLQKDYRVNKVASLIEFNEEIKLSPIVAKILIDHSIRTHLTIAYKLIDINKKIIFETKDISRELSFYKPKKIALNKIFSKKPEKNFINKKIKDPLELKEFALMGLERNFPLYDSASGYGTALTTSSGKIYWGGQYSSPDKRLGLHSEMSTVISALMAGEKKILKIGIVSSKYLDSPCNMCGICRQFISEISAKYNMNPVLYCFSKETDEYKIYSLKEYLPDVWTSKKW